MEDLFENGRQDALSDLEKTLNRRMVFAQSCFESEDKYAFTKEQIGAFVHIYDEVLSTVRMLKDKKESSKRWAKNKSPE